LAKISKNRIAPLESIENPSNLPTCPRKMLMAMQFRKPTSIGFDWKSAKDPRRKKLATIQMSPVKNVNAIERDKYRSALPEASGAMVAAIIAGRFHQSCNAEVRIVPARRALDVLSLSDSHGCRSV
jgi:hypothetical protein